MSKRMSQSDTLYDMTSLQQTVVRANLAGAVAPTDELFLIEQLRSGNEAAFASLVDRYAPTMLRLAMNYVKVWAVAEEVVQETWLFRILTNCAITRAQREGRSIPFSSLTSSDPDLAEPEIDPDRFFPADHQWAGQWVSFPSNWQEMPEERVLSRETRARLEKAIEALPPSQRQIIIMRDIEGWTSEETCNFLGISEVNQRVLLHRARSKVRGMLEQYFEEE